MREKRKERGEGENVGGALKIYLYMLKKMLIRCVKNGGDFRDSLILLLLNSRADGARLTR